MRFPDCHSAQLSVRAHRVSSSQTWSGTAQFQPRGHGSHYRTETLVWRLDAPCLVPMYLWTYCVMAVLRPRVGALLDHFPHLSLMICLGRLRSHRLTNHACQQIWSSEEGRFIVPLTCPPEHLANPSVDSESLTLSIDYT